MAKLKPRGRPRVVTAKEGATFDVGDVLQCPCGDGQTMTGYIAAHWGISLIRECVCGRQIGVRGGYVEMVSEPL